MEPAIGWLTIVWRNDSWDDGSKLVIMVKEAAVVGSFKLGL